MDDATLMKIAVAALGPAMIAGLVLLAAWWRQRTGAGFVERGEPGDRIDRGGEPFWLMIALPCALLPVLHLWITGARAFPPVGASQWVPLIVLGVGLVELVLRLASVKGTIANGVRVLALAAAGYACARTFLHAGEASVAESIATIGIFTLGTTAMAWIADAVASRTRGLGGPLPLVVTIGAATQLIGLGMSNLFVSLTLTGAASILGAACVVALMRGRFSLAFGGTYVPVATLAVVAFIAFLANSPETSTNDPSRRWIYAGAILASVLLPGLVLLPQFRRTHGWARLVLVVGLAGLPMVGALGVLGLDQMSAKEPDSEYDYSAAAPIRADSTMHLRSAR